ncbi:DUF4388 domain-containing protein [Dictyobacter kobayashii]|uniref:DUF4388 domain-containing protein n=1 Tax=Dictyobacter kobayashii TaxID=2014872 RepID=UPI000F83936E|nr:DUF4388 domain-containing protein [Dictyobacter kobayashii]
MSQQQGIVTNNLANVIRKAQTERMSGELRVWRGNNTNTEVGSITFIYGQIVSARLGSYQGPQAFNMLSAWGQCLFVFIATTPPPFQQTQNPVTGPLRTPLSPGSGTLPSQERVSEAHSGPLLSLTAIPCATMSVVKAIGVIERAGLPRPYRQLILLIDGQRSVEELIVTLGLEPGEVSQMLQMLERLKIIRMAR